MSIKKNTTYNLLGSVIPIIVSLLSVPLYLSVIGLERYGLLSILWVILGYLSVFDFGLSKSVAFHIKKLPDQFDELLTSSFLVSLLLGIVATIVFYGVIAVVVTGFDQVEDVVRDELKQVAFITSLLLALAIINSVFFGVLQGCEKFFFLNVYSSFFLIFSQIVPIFFCWIVEGSITVVMYSLFFIRLFFIVFALMYLFRLSKLHISFSYDVVKALVSYGKWVSVSSVVGPLMTSSDRVLLGYFSGGTTTGLYSIAYQLTDKLKIFSTALSGVLFPRFTALDESQKIKLLNKSYIITLLFMLLVSVCFLVILPYFLEIWLSDDVDLQKISSIASVLLVGLCSVCVAKIPYTYLQAAGRPDVVAKVHVFELLPYFVALAFAAKHYGVLGVATVFSLRCFFDFLILSIFSHIDKRLLLYSTLLICLLLPFLFYRFDYSV